MLQLDSTLWQPKDYDDTTLGWISMRRSLYESRNLSTIGSACHSANKQ